MNKLDKDYQALLQDILDNGIVKEDRTGTGTKSLFGRQIRHKMSDGFPLLTTKKMAWKSMVVELLWFLQGDTNIQYLVKNGCHIWDGDCFKRYTKEAEKLYKKEKLDKTVTQLNFAGIDAEVRLFTREEFIEKIKTDDEFAKKWGDLGPIYGKQWRKWTSIKNEGEIRVESYIDQIGNLMNDLKHNPDSRRLMVNAWKVDEIDTMTLPPCHYGFQCYTRKLTLDERMDLAYQRGYDGTYRGHDICDQIFIPSRTLSLMWNQRSVDTFLGLPFNIASYGLLLLMLADEMNMIPDELIGNLGDTHLYLNHLDQAREQIGRDYTIDERIKLSTEVENFDPCDFGIGLEMDEENLHKICDEYGVPRRTREPLPLPKVVVQDGMYCSSVQDVILLDYISHPKIDAPLSN